LGRSQSGTAIEGNRWWGRLPGTSSDRESMEYMASRFEGLGLSVEYFPYTLPSDWRATDWSASYSTEDESTVHLNYRVSGRSHENDGSGRCDGGGYLGRGRVRRRTSLGRDVAGKAVVIYSVFVPGGRSHSASDRSRLFDANNRAVERGAAMVINVIGVPGNGQFQPEGAITEVPHFTLSMDEGFALRDRLGEGQAVEFTFQLEAEILQECGDRLHLRDPPGDVRGGDRGDGPH
jgi:hypothetical protein